MPEERLSSVATYCCMPVRRSQDGFRTAHRASSSVIALLGLDWEDEIDSSWHAPFTAWIELASCSDAAVAELVERAARHSLFASLSAASANRIALARGLVLTISDHRPIALAQRNDLELALHEAIANAILHGNLEIDGIRTLNLADLDRFSQDIIHRTDEPALAARRVEVACSLEDDRLQIDVTDQGRGFSSGQPGAVGAGGRGLQLIATLTRSCQLLDGGRCIRMEFAL
ncbi:MAG: hypothetical protein GC191_15720 [Azospirillum sp.]|nr:hypothetical protein [Azospirillum sp.]